MNVITLTPKDDDILYEWLCTIALCLSHSELDSMNHTFMYVRYYHA